MFILCPFQVGSPDGTPVARVVRLHGAAPFLQDARRQRQSYSKADGKGMAGSKNIWTTAEPVGPAAGGATASMHVSDPMIGP